jgi:hypothetical protein
MNRLCQHAKSRPAAWLVDLMRKLATQAQEGQTLTPCHRCYCQGPGGVTPERFMLQGCARCWP